MKKNKLFAALAAITMLTSAGAVVGSNNVNTTVMAAKKSTTAKVRVKSGAPLYNITFNKKGTKVTKISPLKSRGRAQALRGGTFNAIWSKKYKGVNYYYIGNSGSQSWAVRTRDAKIIGKKKVPTINAFVKANKAKYAKAAAKQKAKVNQRKALAKQWQDKIDAARPKTYTGKINAEVPSNAYAVANDQKFQAATENLSMGTKVTVIYKQEGAFKRGSESIDGLVARDNDDNKLILIPSSYISLDSGSVSDVLTSDQYSAANKNVENIYQQAKKALGIK